MREKRVQSGTDSQSDRDTLTINMRFEGDLSAMEQGPILQHPLPIPSDYPLQSEHDCIAEFAGHAHHYNPAGTVELRRDGALPHQSPASFAFAAPNHHQLGRLPERGVASDVSSYHSTHQLTDSSGGSISTSPSSAASSLQYTTYPPNHYTSSTSFFRPALPPQAFTPGFHPGASISDGSTLGLLPPPIRATLPAVLDAERDVYTTTATPFLARGQLSPHTQPSFTSYPETPRAVLPTGIGAPYLPGLPYNMSSGGGYGTTPAESMNFPWPNLEVLLEMTCEGQQVTPEVHCKVEKGFFCSTVDNKWTCYRRNYFSVTCHFTLHPNINNGRIYLKRNNTTEQIQAMGMRLSAAVDGSGGKSIELIQHTPKRDNGPKTKIEVTKVSPTPTTGRGDHSLSPNGIYTVPMSTFHATGAVSGPYLPLQQSGETNGIPNGLPTPQLSSYGGFSPAATAHLPIPGHHISHTFERVQFKQATANNGKRRASQQYFHLIVELCADVRKEGSDTPVWIKIAQRVSEKIVVRGRSPSHYQNEGQHGQAGRGGSASGSGGYSGASGGYTVTNAGGFRGASGGYGSGLSSTGAYRGTQYAMHPSSDGSGSSPSSVDEGAVDTEHPMDTVMSDAERAGYQDHEGYRYYPGPIYEGIGHTLPPLAKVEGPATYTTEPRQYAVKAEYADAVPGAQWPVGGYSRFHGVESSRGFFPDIAAGFT